MSGAAQEVGPVRRWYAVFILALLYAFALIDRNILSLVVDEIKADVGITDLQYALLHGLAFVIFYSVVGLPIGGLLDRYSRRGLIWAGVTIWSVMAMATGLSRTFPQMFAARLGVGVGEAAISPGAYSLISDLFPKSKLSAPTSMFIVGGTIGSGLAVWGGGLLLQGFTAGSIAVPAFLQALAPWRLVLLATSAPGILLALLVFTIPEPARRDARDGGAGWPEFLAHLRTHHRVYVPVILGFSMMVLVTYASFTWTPTFLRRVHGVAPAQVGVIFGLVTAGCGTLAHAVNGFIVDALYRRGVADAPLRFALVSAGIGLPFAVAAYVVPSLPAFIVCLSLTLLLVTPVLGYGGAAIQMITPPRMRAKAGALFLLAISVIGLGLGPIVVAALTDKVFGSPDRLGWSLMITILVAVPLGLVLLWSARGRFRAMVGALEAA